jgi:hypothetical protein
MSGLACDEESDRGLLLSQPMSYNVCRANRNAGLLVIVFSEFWVSFTNEKCIAKWPKYGDFRVPTMLVRKS